MCHPDSQTLLLTHLTPEFVEVLVGWRPGGPHSENQHWFSAFIHAVCATLKLLSTPFTAIKCVYIVYIRHLCDTIPGGNMAVTVMAVLKGQDRKLRSFWVEWRSYHICRCSRTYILNNLIHQLHNVFSLRRTSRCTDSRSNHWSGIQVARARCQDGRATTARMSLKAGTADSMYGNNGEHFTKASCSKL